MKKQVIRWTVYLLGLFILAFGVALSMKVNLGVSPISSIAFSISEIWAFDLAVVNFVVYTVFVAAQFVLRGKNSRVIDLLQLAVSVVFSWAMGLLKDWLPYDAADYDDWVNIVLLFVSIVIIGIGVSFSVKMRLIPNPGDGIVHALSEKTGWEHGFAKNVFDISCVCVTTVIGFIFVRDWVGVYWGTAAAMLGVGRVVALVNRFVMKKLCAAAGVDA